MGGASPQAAPCGTSEAYDDYVVFVESKSLRRQVRKLAQYYPKTLAQDAERTRVELGEERRRHSSIDERSLMACARRDDGLSGQCWVADRPRQAENGRDGGGIDGDAAPGAS